MGGEDLTDLYVVPPLPMWMREYKKMTITIYNNEIDGGVVSGSNVLNTMGIQTTTVATKKSIEFEQHFCIVGGNGGYNGMYTA